MLPQWSRIKTTARVTTGKPSAKSTDTTINQVESGDVHIRTTVIDAVRRQERSSEHTSQAADDKFVRPLAHGCSLISYTDNKEGTGDAPETDAYKASKRRQQVWFKDCFYFE